MNCKLSITKLARLALAASAMLLGGVAAHAQSVSITAAPTTATLPDGQMVPMWGYSCDATQPTQTAPAVASCAALNASAGGAWSPVKITVPYSSSGTSLTINLTNKLSFPAATLPTSLVIVGQLGGGLGTARTTVASPTHGAIGVTWFASSAPGTNVGAITVTSGGSGYSSTPAVKLTGGGGTGATATANVVGGVIQSIAVSNPGTGYSSAPTVSITDSTGHGASASVALADIAGGAPTFTPPPQGARVQSLAAEVSVSAGQTALTWSNLRPGTYLIQSGTQSPIQVPMGLYGVLVVTTPPAADASAPGTAYPGVSYDADVPLVFGEIDPVQNQAVATAVATAGFSPSNVWSGQAGQCGDIGSATSTATANTCFPPAVNYDPRYYLINGVSFDRTNLAASTQQILATMPTSPTNTVLLRLVNAGLRMHVPAVVGRTMTLFAEDGNLLPGLPRVQSEVFLAAGKTYDVGIKWSQPDGSFAGATLPVYDRQLSLSTNNQRDGGMQAYIGVLGGATSGVGTTGSSGTTAVANADQYYLPPAGALSVAEAAKGVVANDVGVYGVTLLVAPTGGSVTLNADGTFSYTANAGVTSDSFTYCANGTVTGTTCSSGLTAKVTLAACTGSCLGGAPTLGDASYTSAVASLLKVGAPGLLLNAVDPSGLTMTAKLGTCGATGCLPDCTGQTPPYSNCVALNKDGSFKAYTPGPGTYTFSYLATNAQGTSSNPATATLTMQKGNGYTFTVTGLTATPGMSIPITDYRWIIEEDKTWYSDPLCQINTTGTRTDSHGNACPPMPVESLAYSFHTANMPVVATGCTGAVSCEQGQTVLGQPAHCDIGNGQCLTDAGYKDITTPDQVHLDPNKRYFISILPGDAINPTVNGQGAPVTDPVTGKTRPFSVAIDCPGASDFAMGSGQCGHGMGGTSIGVQQTAVNVILQPTPLPTAQIAAFVYEDDNPLNGENDAGGGVDVLAPNEPGLGGFELKIFDQAGGLGDPTGQITYDMFNYPVSNALANTMDPITGMDACPISTRGDGLIGMIPTCPKYESDGVTLSPLAGQAVIKNLYPGLYEIVATPGADRITRGEEWLQTNTLDGGRAHEASIKPNEPAYFQEFGPGGFHVSIGFANPAIVNGRLTNSSGTGLCDKAPSGGGLTCASNLTVNVAKTHMARTPDQRVYSTGSYDAYNFTQCYVSIGPADGADFAFQKCDPNGSVTFNNIPNGDWKLVVFDEWNDITLDGLVNAVSVHCDTSVASCDPTKPVTMTQEFPVTQWRTNIYTRTFLDQNQDGVSQDATDPGLALVATNIRYRDGSYGFFNNTDLNGYANFNEVFPFMNWLVVEADTTRYKNTSIHSVYDTGGPVDGSSPNGVPCNNGTPTSACGNSAIASRLANTVETNSLPDDLRVPGAYYCADADCTATASMGGKFLPYYGGTASGGFTLGDGTLHSAGRIDPPMPWGTTMGWQGLLGQTSFVEFGMKPFVPGENGGIKGHVIYASTRPFDDPMLLLQTQWEPGVPRVKINLYQEGTAPDGTTSLTLVDTTTTTSFDDWAQGFRHDASGNLMTYTDPTTHQVGYIPNMNCPGQAPDSPFFATLQGSKQFLDADKHALAANSQFKCFDGWAMLNQTQPAPYDGMYKFPSVTAVDPKTGRPTLSNCTACTKNPDDGNPMLPAGKYVVEVIVPPGFELVKEEDKNILMGDIYVAPVTAQFGGLGSIFIMPDQASVNAAYNKNNPLNATNALGSTTFPRHEGDTGSIESYWPCVGAMRIVPDYNSLFPSAQQNSPFAGALRPLCDRKEVTLQDQASALAKFYIFTPTHIAGHFTGTITNDLASEFDPFSPQFGEKFGPPNLPVSMRDFTGIEVNRVYSDQWGVYNGLFTSTWEVNPPNPTGYGPTMAIACMNDPGPVAGPNGPITDPAYNSAYSNFCYETPFMPGFTAYMDTPVVPLQAFADQYNLPDAQYPNYTPAIKTVTSSAIAGPWVPVGAPVSKLTLGSGGSGYTAVPSVAITSTDGQGSGATATATMSITAINVTNPGSGYTSNDLNGSSASGSGVTIAAPGGGGTTATVAAGGITLKVVSVSFTQTNIGTCSASTSHSVNFSGGGNGATQATAHATLNGNKLASIVLDTAGTYTGVPTVTVLNCGGLSTTAKMGVGTIAVNVPGSGYTSLPTITFATPSGGTAATGAASMSVNALALNSGGSAYDAAPTVAFSGGAPTATATATAALGAGVPAGTLTITALGDQTVINPAYSGPNTSTPPYNQKTITRHYGFGAQPAGCPTSGACPNVTIGGVPMTGVSWSDGTITGTVPAGIPLCSATNSSYTGANASALCGELVITAANGKTSIDAITVTAGGSKPTLLGNGQTIQSAIDAANPGDMIIVPAGTYKEHLLMWKPVRVQGVGATVVTINADAHPSGVLDPWRRQVNCLFGLSINGVPSNSGSLGQSPPSNNFDPTGTYSCPDNQFLRADRIPFEAIIGWDSTGNGNLAQVLQEPTLMGAYEGAGVTVLGRGAKAPSCNDATFGTNCNDFWGQSATGGAGAFTDGSTWLSAADCTPIDPNNPPSIGRDYYSSNYYCNPSRIDGVSIINSSQGGGGVFVHGWAQNLEISNTHISANQGTLSGAINLGNGETPDAYLNDGVECGPSLLGANAVTPCPPIQSSGPLKGIGTVTNAAIPFQFNTGVHIHHNAIINNVSIGDALFSGSPAGSGGITISAGSDAYQIDHNWIAGNLTSGDGGGIQHVGLSFKGNISHNYVLFNQSTNPTLPTNGGGVVIMGANVDRVVNGDECGSTNDVDCTPGIGEGAGGGLVVDANLILGNSAESGSGGGLRLQQINGQEVATFNIAPNNWYDITVTNNIIVNNVAGWDGAGISLEDALKAKVVNNTIASNDTTASAGVLFKTLGAAMAASPPPGCDPAGITGPLCAAGGSAAHNPQPAGLVTEVNTPNMVASLTGLNVACPGNPYGYANGNCKTLSLPLLTNNLFWQNRAFHVEISGLGTGLISQQNLVALVPALNQPTTGYCAASGFAADGKTSVAAPYWDLGVRGDVNPNDGKGGAKLSLSNSILTPITGITYSGLNNLYPAMSPVVAQYCNGSRIPPENGGHGYNAPAGRSETTGLSTLFVFNNIAPAVTVDEGNNWINLTYGPLTLTRPGVSASTNAEMMLASAAYGVAEGAYSVPANSPAVAGGAAANAPATDFFGSTRSTTKPTIGAVEYAVETFATVRPTDLEFGNVMAGGTSATQTLTLTVGSAALNNLAIAVSGPFSRVTGGATDCGTVLSLATGSCTIAIAFNPTAVGPATGSVQITSTSGVIADSPVGLTGTGVTFDLTVLPGTLNLASVYVGQTSAAQTLTLTNNTNPAATVTGVAPAISGPFARSGGSCPTTATFSLASGASCTVGIVFQPTAAGTATGSVAITADAGFSIGGSPVALSGTAYGLPSVNTAALNFGTVVQNSAATTQTLTLSNPLGAPTFTFTSIAVTGSAEFTRSGGTCATSLAANSTCTVIVSFNPTSPGAATGQVAFIGGNAPSVVNAPVTLSGTVVAPTHLGTITGGPLSFGNWATGTTSSAQTLTLTNTGNSPLTGLSFAFNTGSRFSRPGGGAGGNCPLGLFSLPVGASCTYGVVFSPNAIGPVTGTLTISGANGATITGSPVSLSGTGVSGRATVAISAPTITLPSGALSGTGLVTLTNTAATGGAQVNVTNIAVSGGSALTYFFNVGAAPLAGPDNCTGVALAPQSSCTVTVRFTNVGSARGTNRSGTITFTDNGANSPQTGNLTGFATP